MITHINDEISRLPLGKERKWSKAQEEEGGRAALSTTRRYIHLVSPVEFQWLDYGKRKLSRFVSVMAAWKLFALRCARLREKKERNSARNWLAALFLLVHSHQGRMDIEKLQNSWNYLRTPVKVSRILWIMDIRDLWCEINFYRVLNQYLRLTNRHGPRRRPKRRLTKINDRLLAMSARVKKKYEMDI